jgi:hypothetical protein
MAMSASAFRTRRAPGAGGTRNNQHGARFTQTPEKIGTFRDRLDHAGRWAGRQQAAARLRDCCNRSAISAQKPGCDGFTRTGLQLDGGKYAEGNDVCCGNSDQTRRTDGVVAFKC